MSAPRHLGRVILQILAVVDPIAEATEEVIEPLIEERDALRRTEEQLRHRPPELIGTSHWQLSLSPVLEIIGFLAEPHKGKVQAIWNGVSIDDATAGLTWKILPINPGDRIAKCYAAWQGDDLLIRFEVEDGKRAMCHCGIPVDDHTEADHMAVPIGSDLSAARRTGCGE